MKNKRNKFLPVLRYFNIYKNKDVRNVFLN